ncbi:hypothetical protein Xvie_00748 [Xenorhabdus vietnamensis]|uniref:DUF2326 domain-containing protein n=1 Tax=Xenorhabdus vietnamensis TaxID=351656 RepID=A0A1Y2SJ57_9GAMM|nr:DUF2326 domain-containing protein [Xenorhabdus vietnamensis]OTA18062.1 hypothetical protein Xvie_00748 [Xenorhabdus vietnamensis]
MLTEIRSDVFKNKTIKFHEGLNVVLGDSVATNSIGKSTLLMLVDFSFGGESFIKNDGGAVENLGHHSYFIIHEFGKEKYIFKRGTFKPDLIYICSNDYEEQEAITLDYFKVFLKAQYKLETIELSFRAIISLFSRIWGRENLEVKKPLHDHPSNNGEECIEKIIKLFERYTTIRELSQQLKDKNTEKQVLSGAFRQKFIPKITKTQYRKNLKEIDRIQREIEEIKSNLAKYAINLSEIASKEFLELKEQKDLLLDGKTSITSRLSRVRNNLNKNNHIKSTHFAGLKKFFPDVNEEKIAEIEEFHCNITKILKSELKASERELQKDLELITDEIKKIDERINKTLSKIDNPEIIVDRVYNLSNSHKETVIENNYFETEENIKLSINDMKSDLKSEKEKILKFIEDLINDKIKSLVTFIYSKNHKSPELTLNDKNYQYKTIDNTGTGTAYSNLLLLDIAIFELTKLPILIHDSLLYKNIANDAVSHFIDLYLKQDKQSFIAIDEIEKYGQKTKETLEEKKVIKLTNQDVLYVKDWREKKSPNTYEPSRRQ